MHASLIFTPLHVLQVAIFYVSRNIFFPLHFSFTIVTISKMIWNHNILSISFNINNKQNSIIQTYHQNISIPTFNTSHALQPMFTFHSRKKLPLPPQKHSHTTISVFQRANSSPRAKPVTRSERKLPRHFECAFSLFLSLISPFVRVPYPSAARALTFVFRKDELSPFPVTGITSGKLSPLFLSSFDFAGGRNVTESRGRGAEG